MFGVNVTLVLRRIVTEKLYYKCISFVNGRVSVFSFHSKHNELFIKCLLSFSDHRDYISEKICMNLEKTERLNQKLL